MSEHSEKADALERDADDMEHQSEKLEREIGDVREDWEAKQRDAKVPGAVGEAVGDAGDEEGDPPPEANQATSGD